jgi:hypothetical protein
MTSFFINPLLRLRPLLVILDFPDNSLNLDLGKRTSKARVEGEPIVWPNLPTFRTLGQNPKLSACQRL